MTRRSERPDVSAVLVASDEGPRIGISLHSLLDAAATARSAGLTVETVAVLADASVATRTALAEAADHGVRVERLDATDPGVVRNRAVEVASGDHVAVLDDGALWSRNWLVAAHEVCASDPGRVVAHPEIEWFYEAGRELYFPPDQDRDGFDPAALQFGACWSTQAMAAAAVYRAVPFPAVGEGAEPGTLDWAWSKATVGAGLRHRVAPATVSFRRRRPRTLR